MWFRLWTLCNVHLINWTLSCSLHVTCNIPYLIFSVPAFWKLHHSLFFKALKHKIVQEERAISCFVIEEGIRKPPL